MSDEDRDVDIDSDDDDLGNSSSTNDASSKHSFQSQADKRAHHNALERKRRDHIKDSFSSLRDSVPALHGEKVKPYKASRAQILKKAAEYIQIMRRKNSVHQQDIDDIKRQNKILEEQIVRALEKAKNGGLSNFSGTSLLDNKVKTESIDSSFDGISDTESSESEVILGNNDSSASLSGGTPETTASFGPPSKKLRITQSVSVTDTSSSSSTVMPSSGVITSI